MLLDLLAVLLGGATALMPVFARDILHVGPVGLGTLRAAPYVGALVMAIVLTHVRQTLKEYERMLGQIEDLKGLRYGEVTVATMYTLAGELLPSVVRGFLERHKRVEVNIRVIVNIAEAVLASDADIGVGFNLPVAPGLRVYAAVPVTFGAVVAPDHPLATRETITIAGCASFPLIMHDAGMSFRPMLDRALAPLDGQFSVASTTNSIDFMKRGARAGIGVAFLSRLNVLDELKRGELAYIPLTDPPIPQDRLMIICRARDVLSGIAGLLAEDLRRSMEQLFAPDAPA
jgi:DNA-binding transcriptional LysR family regulator